MDANTSYPVKPKLFSSRCLGFEACRWNGLTISDEFVERLKNFVNFVSVCPEMEIGLGVPRSPVRVVSRNQHLYLLQSESEKDCTERMEAFAKRFLENLGELDGFILKDRSPSCGLNNVKVYPCPGKCGVIALGSGFFASAVLKSFPDFPVETEARLSNSRLREHFLTRIFTNARFRALKADASMGALVRFHAENKFLLMAYNQREMRLLGNIAANHQKRPAREIFREYEQHLLAALLRLPRPVSAVNALMHGLGYVSDKLSRDEKQFLLKIIEQYRNKKVPLSVPCALLKSQAIRFNERYLLDQSFFEPYPAELAELTDTDKGRSLKA